MKAPTWPSPKKARSDFDSLPQQQAVPKQNSLETDARK
jgi:hypothetical protein